MKDEKMTDQELTKALRDNPAIFRDVVTRAEMAFLAVKREWINCPREFDEAWNNFAKGHTIVNRAIQMAGGTLGSDPLPFVPLYRAAERIAAIFEALAKIDSRARPGLVTMHGQFARTPDARKAVEADAVLAAWLAERDKREAELERIQAGERAREYDQVPRHILAQLRSRRIELTLQPEGTITCQQGAALTPHELRTIADRKEDFVAILKAEAAEKAARERPVVLA